MEHEQELKDLADLRPGDHLCCLYETEEEHRALVTPYIRQGLERNEKVVYIVDAHASKEILAYLEGDGFDPRACLASGQLSMLTRDDSYMRDGTFDPDGMISLLRSETDLAQEQGYACLRVTGEMTWALRGAARFRTPHRIRGQAEPLLSRQPRHGHLPVRPPPFLSRTPAGGAHHPSHRGGRNPDLPNFYFMPTDEFLQEDRSAATLVHWLKNLEDRQAAERRSMTSTPCWKAS